MDEGTEVGSILEVIAFGIRALNCQPDSCVRTEPELIQKHGRWYIPPLLRSSEYQHVWSVSQRLIRQAMHILGLPITRRDLSAVSVWTTG